MACRTFAPTTRTRRAVADVGLSIPMSQRPISPFVGCDNHVPPACRRLIETDQRSRNMAWRLQRPTQIFSESERLRRFWSSSLTTILTHRLPQRTACPSRFGVRTAARAASPIPTDIPWGIEPVLRCVNPLLSVGRDFIQSDRLHHRHQGASSAAPECRDTDSLDPYVLIEAPGQ